MNHIKTIHLKLPIFLTLAILCSFVPGTVLAGDTEVEEIDEFEEIETPGADEKAALGEMEKMVATEAPVIDDVDADALQAKRDAELAEKQLADSQKKLEEMKKYKTSLALKTKQEVVQAEKRKELADRERAALDAQRRQIETEVAEIVRQQKKLEAIERAARLKAERAAERARIKLAAAKEKRSQKRKATTKAVPPKSKKNSLDPKKSAQQARI